MDDEVVNIFDYIFAFWRVDVWAIKGNRLPEFDLVPF